MVIRKKKLKAKHLLFFIFSHTAIGFIGFLLGIYSLPLITAEGKPSQELSDLVKNDAVYKVNFEKDLKGSDFLHWGEGQISIAKETILFRGNFSPGPDYKLNLTKTFVSDELDFLKEREVKIGAINSLAGFLIELTEGPNLKNYNSVLIWCVSFSEFITSTQYRN